MCYTMLQALLIDPQIAKLACEDDVRPGVIIKVYWKGTPKTFDSQWNIVSGSRWLMIYITNQELKTSANLVLSQLFTCKSLFNSYPVLSR